MSNNFYKLNDGQIRGKLKDLLKCQKDLHNYLAKEIFSQEPFDIMWIQKFNYGQYNIKFEYKADFMDFKYTIDMLIKAYALKELEDIEYAKVVEYCGRFNWYDEIMYLLFSELTTNRYHVINVMCELEKIGLSGLRTYYLKEFTECDKVDQNFKDEVLAKLVINKLSKNS